MSTNNPNLNFKIDIQDFEDDEQIISTIKNILKMAKDDGFIKSFYEDEAEKILINVPPNISFIISGCDCPSEELPF
jgi:hypothetical protein